MIELNLIFMVCYSKKNPVKYEASAMYENVWSIAVNRCRIFGNRCKMLTNVYKCFLCHS